jgi:hypothetical protein
MDNSLKALEKSQPLIRATQDPKYELGGWQPQWDSRRPDPATTVSTDNTTMRHT